ncbi:hypothetical protein D3C81_1377990 [compost metagenome]
MQVLEQMVDLAGDGHAVGNDGFVMRTVAEIGGDRLDHLWNAGLEHRAQPAKVIAPLGVVGPLLHPCVAQLRQSLCQCRLRIGLRFHAASPPRVSGHCKPRCDWR